MQPTWLLVAIAGLLLAAACSGNTASDEATAPPEATATASSTATSTPTPEASPTATATPENLLAFLYIAQTGGDGVSIRDACRDDARAPGAWAEGTAVRVIEPRTDACEGWTYVVGPGEGSWVRNDYLSETAPAVKTPPGRSKAPGSPASPQPAATAMFVFGTTTPGVFVVVFGGGEFCDSTIADAVIGIWGLEVGGGTECDPAPGELLSFAVNGQSTQTAGVHSYTPGGSESITLLTP